MATQLEAGQQLKRLVKIHGIGLVEITLSESGLEFRIPKTRISTYLSLPVAVATSQTPTNVPSYLHGRPTEFLQAQVKKVEQSKAGKGE